LSGFLAWAAWLVVHLWYLIGFQNRILVLIRWTFSFLSHGRGARLITETSTSRDRGDTRMRVDPPILRQLPARPELLGRTTGTGQGIERARSVLHSAIQTRA
jgi:hypothetical protein